MKLEKGIIRPGIVLEVLDNGIIKASAPGLFSYLDGPEKMPPIFPWQIGSNCNNFSKPKKYDDVWIMNFEDNPLQLYWFRKDRIEHNENIPLTETNVEVLCNKKVGGDWATIYFSDGSGWIVGKGKSIIQIRPDGTILLDSNLPGRSIDICGEGIHLGGSPDSKLDFHPVAYGDMTEEALCRIIAALKLIQQTAMLNPHTMPIGTALNVILPQLPGAITKISSNDVMTI
jgi:hypothetical protein